MEKPKISFFCPAYYDAGNIEKVVEKAHRILPEISSTYEILIIEDGSPDNTAEVVDRLSQQYPRVRVIHHPKNRGYGAAMATGLVNIQPSDLVCFTDGDNQYDFKDIVDMIPLLEEYDLVISVRKTKAYGPVRKVISFVYYWMVTLLFRLPYHDVSSSTKLMRGEMLKNLSIDSASPFANAELIIKAHKMGYRINELGIESYPRQSGRASSVLPKNILATLNDMRRMWWWLLWN